MANNPPGIAEVASPDAVWYNMGDLYWEPTDLTTPSGYGTYLGATAEDVLLVPNMADVELDGEELGVEIEDQLHLGLDVHVYAVLGEHNPIAYSMAFGPLRNGSTSAWDYDTQENVGKLRSTMLEGKLLFVPYDRTNHNAFLLYAAQPRLDSTARLQHAFIDYPQLLPIVFRGRADSNGKVISVNKLANLSV